MDRLGLNKATSSEDSPTPGYVFNEIARTTHDAPETAAQLQVYLTKRLQRDDPVVKLKVLRVIKHVCEKGRAEFRMSMQRKADGVKACLQYRGTPDPLKGDEPSRLVREEAAAALRSIFSNGEVDGATASAGRILGFGNEQELPLGLAEEGKNNHHLGSDCHNGSKGLSARGNSHVYNSGSSYVGFGNPRFDYSTTPKKPAQYRTEQFMSSFSSVVARVLPGGANYYSSSFGMQNRHQTGPSASSELQPGFRPPALVVTNSAQSNVQQKISAAPGEYEARLLERISLPGGPKHSPTREALDDFCLKAETLDAVVVGSILLARLECDEYTWQRKMKLLYVIEALVVSELRKPSRDGQTEQKYLDFFLEKTSATYEVLSRLQNMFPQCRNKASHLLEVIMAQRTPSSPNSNKHRRQQEDVNLLDVQQHEGDVIQNREEETCLLLGTDEQRPTTEEDNDLLSFGTVPPTNPPTALFASLNVRNAPSHAGTPVVNCNGSSSPFSFVNRQKHPPEPYKRDLHASSISSISHSSAATSPSRTTIHCSRDAFDFIADHLRIPKQ